MSANQNNAVAEAAAALKIAQAALRAAKTAQAEATQAAKASKAEASPKKPKADAAALVNDNGYFPAALDTARQTFNVFAVPADEEANALIGSFDDPVVGVHPRPLAASCKLAAAMLIAAGFVDSLAELAMAITGVVCANVAPNATVPAKFEPGTADCEYFERSQQLCTFTIALCGGFEPDFLKSLSHAQRQVLTGKLTASKGKFFSPQKIVRRTIGALNLPLTEDHDGNIVAFRHMQDELDSWLPAACTTDLNSFNRPLHETALDGTKPCIRLSHCADFRHIAVIVVGLFLAAAAPRKGKSKDERVDARLPLFVGDETDASAVTDHVKAMLKLFNGRSGAHLGLAVVSGVPPAAPGYKAGSLIPLAPTMMRHSGKGISYSDGPATFVECWGRGDQTKGFFEGSRLQAFYHKLEELHDRGLHTSVPSLALYAHKSRVPEPTADDLNVEDDIDVELAEVAARAPVAPKAPKRDVYTSPEASPKKSAPFRLPEGVIFPVRVPLDTEYDPAMDETLVNGGPVTAVAPTTPLKRAAPVEADDAPATPAAPKKARVVRGVVATPEKLFPEPRTLRSSSRIARPAPVKAH